MTLKLAIAPGSRRSAEILGGMLRAKGLLSEDGKPLAVVSYGVPMEASPRCLNARPAMDKFHELCVLHSAGVFVPPHKTRIDEVDFQHHPVWFARKVDHVRGRDLMPVWSPQEADWRLAAGWQYFTAALEVHHEYRTWMFRGRHLGTYRKDMVDPAQFKKHGRGHLNGFSFNRHKDPPEAMRQLADSALTALGLDFGAVDIIQDRCGGYTVLEVNTAPGIDHERRACAKRLVREIVRWYRSL